VKVVLHDRTGGIPPELKDYAQRKLTRLERHFGRVVEAELEFTEESKRFGLGATVCRIHVHIDGHRAPALSAKERGPDAQSALDLALDKIDRQVVRLKEKVTHRKQPKSAVRVPDTPKVRGDGPPEPEVIRIKLMPESIEQAVAELESDGQPFHVFLDEFTGSVQIAFRRPDGSVAVIDPVIP